VNTTPYWLEEPREPLPRRTLSGPADVIVVGAGATGCSCALTLAEAGARVRVHEAREVAGGASGRNGGFALRGAATPYDRACAELGREPARALWALTERTLDRIEALAGDAFRRVGSIRLAVDEAERAELEREVGALREDGFSAEWLDVLRPPLDGLYCAAVRTPGDGALQPARWVRRLARAAVDAGGEVAELSPVELTPAGIERLDAPVVVLALDGWLPSSAAELGAAMTPARGQVLATEPLPERLYDVPHYARGGYDYWLQTADGRLVLGGKRDTSPETEHTFSEEPTELIQGRLDELAAQLLGRPPRVTHRWAGIWSQAPDRLPVAGPLPGHDRMWVAGGYAGHGNVLGVACGALVARAILGNAPPELALFDPGRLPGLTGAP
jgi:gamma-glutamylputrescine oxidase